MRGESIFNSIYGINLLYFSSNRAFCLHLVWKLLKGSGLKKEPGLSLIEVKGTIEKLICYGGFFIFKDWRDSGHAQNFKLDCS
uniref:Uncharacterized protein n=1 Tax=Salix viminalis TaxID=40686 RepID=A0A6N2KFR4_SALVM